MNIKSILKYTLSLVVAGALLWYVFRDIDLNQMVKRLADINYFWIAVSMVMAIASHMARAYRWNILLKPLGYTKLTTGRTFLALMIGYVANLIIPRMGEVTRCGVLKKQDGVRMSASIGSVVAERVLDLLVLLGLLAIAFFVEFDQLGIYLMDKYGAVMANLFRLQNILIVVVSIAAIGAFLILLYRKFRGSLYKSSLFVKISGLVKEMIKGLTSIRNIDNQLGFWASTFFIWFMYYTMAYVVVIAIPETVGLSMGAVLVVLVMGGFGMSAPVQGGIGAYHFLVSSVLVLYGVSANDGIFFATVMHTSQTLLHTTVGLISLIISFGLRSSSNPVNATAD